MNVSSKQKKIKDPCVLRCSKDNVNKFSFIKEKDFLCEYLPQLETYKKKQERIKKLKRKLPPKIYLKHLQSLRSELISDLSLLKKEYSPQVTKKYETLSKQQSLEDPNLKENEKKKLKRQQKMREQKEKIKKLKEEFTGTFEFFKADVQIGENRDGKYIIYFIL